MHRSLLRAGAPHGPLRRSRGHRVLATRPLAEPYSRRTAVLQLAVSSRAAAPTAAPPEASLTASLRAPTTVTLADGTTVTLVDPTPRQLLRQQQTGVAWTGLLGALALTATALMTAAVTCFMLYVRPVLKAMSVTLAEMEQAAKDMQQAADHVEAASQLLQAQLPATAAAVEGAAAEVQELAGSINKAAKLLTPANLLRRTGSGSSSSDQEAGSSSRHGGTGSGLVQGNLGPSSLLDGIRDLGFGPQLHTLQNLAAVPSGISDLWSSLDDDGSSSSSSSRSGGRAGSPVANGSNSGAKTVWDALAVTAAAAASKGSLERLRSDLKAAVNVISVLLTPAGHLLAPTAAGASAAAGDISTTAVGAASSDGADADASKRDEHHQQQQQHEISEVATVAAAPAAAVVGDCNQEQTAPSPPSGLEAMPVAAAAAAAVAATAATEDEVSSPLSSADGRIRIAAGIRLSGSTAVLKSLSEEDIEHALAAAAASSSSSGSPDHTSSSSGVDHPCSGSSHGVDRNDDWRGDGGPTTVGSFPGVEMGQPVTAAAALSPPAAAAPIVASGTDASASAAEPAAAAAAAVEVSGTTSSSSRSRASSPSGRRRRKSKKIGEDEWGLPTVMNMSSDACNTSDEDCGGSSSSRGRASVVQQAADAPAAVGAAAVISSSAISAAAAAASTIAPHDHVRSAAATAARSSSSSSYMAPNGWVDCSDDEDYAGYKETNNCYDSFDEGIIQQMSTDRHGGGSSSSAMFAGYDACQDVHLSARPDDGITWSQLQQDPQLMQRVFCDNQEQILQSGISSSSSQQQQRTKSPDAHS